MQTRTPNAPALALALVAVLGGCSESHPTAATATASTPATAQIVTADLARFWAAWDAGGKDGASAPFQARYLDSATAGLRDFIGLRQITAASLAQMVQRYPRYFAAIKANNLRLATEPTFTAQVRANYATLKALYPAAVFPPLTLTVGRFSTGGTVGSNGILIGSEFYSVDATTPLDELGTFQRDNVHGTDVMALVIAHEHAHVQQNRVPNGVITHANRNLLEQSLMEGGADFIGEKASGGNSNARIHPYGLAHEAALWVEFQAAMHGTDISRWLYNQGTTATAERPGDLGYFVGYRICEAYYNATTDKAAAIRDIIEIRSGDDFLARSGYNPR